MEQEGGAGESQGQGISDGGEESGALEVHPGAAGGLQLRQLYQKEVVVILITKLCSPIHIKQVLSLLKLKLQSNHYLPGSIVL